MTGYVICQVSKLSVNTCSDRIMDHMANHEVGSKFLPIVKWFSQKMN